MSQRGGVIIALVLLLIIPNLHEILATRLRLMLIFR